MNITAVLLNYARPYNLSPILKALSQHDAVKQVVVWNNSREMATIMCQKLGADWLTWVDSPYNVFTLGRFIAAVRYARHDMIWFQDDDVINPHFSALLRIAQERRTEQAIVAGLPDDESSAHFLWYEVNQPPETDIGFGAFVDRRWIAPCFASWRAEYSDDDYLACRKADKVFTILHGRRILVKTPIKRLRGPDGQESGRDKNALWLRPDHKKLDEEVIAKCLRLRERLRQKKAAKAT